MEVKKANEVAKILKTQILENDPFVNVTVYEGAEDAVIHLKPSELKILSGWWLSRVVMFAAAFGYNAYVSTDIDNIPVLKIY